MARSRNIKPGFFENEYLAQCKYEARLLFAGLWCIADREGKLEDRPLRIKAKIFPYDEVNVGRLLEDLASKEFILRYQVDGSAFISIPSFSKHQNPHCKEQQSRIPDPEKHQTCTMQAPDMPETCTVVAGLIPSSLIPSSLIPSKDLCASKSETLQFDEPKEPTNHWKSEFFEHRFWPKVWMKRGKGEGERAFRKAATGQGRAEYLLERAIEQGPLIMADAKKRKSTPLHVSTWLNGRQYEDDWGEAEDTGEDLY